jgi:hypothetical protein
MTFVYLYIKLYQSLIIIDKDLSFSKNYELQNQIILNMNKNFYQFFCKTFRL